MTAASQPASSPSTRSLRPAGANASLEQVLQLDTRRPLPEVPALARTLLALANACVEIAQLLRRAGIDDILGAVGTHNVQGEAQQKLDVIADDLLMRALQACDSVAVAGSEENHELRHFPGRAPGPRHAVFFDPLDGSSNLDVCGTVGTIFSVFEAAVDGALLAGTHQLAAGYVLYGPSTVLVLTTGRGVRQFVLDGAGFVQVGAELRIPHHGPLYSVNESNLSRAPAGWRAFVADCHAEGYVNRYSGAMIADVHRVLCKGGIFMYPPTPKAPNGKLRLMYEANPAAMLIEQAGGMAVANHDRVLDIAPDALHQRVPLAIGSPAQVQALLAKL